MTYAQTEEKVFTLVDELLMQFTENTTIVFDEDNKTEEYGLAKAMVLEYGLVKYIIQSDKKRLLVLTSVGADVVKKGGIKVSIAELERQKELADKLKFERIQNDINKHIQTRKMMNFLIVVLAIGFLAMLAKWIIT